MDRIFGIIRFLMRKKIFLKEMLKNVYLILESMGMSSS